MYVAGVTAMGPLLARNSDHCSSVDGFNALTQMAVTSGLSIAAWQIIISPLLKKATVSYTFRSSSPYIMDMLATIIQTALTIPAALVPAAVMNDEPVKDTFVQQLLIVLLVSSAFALLQKLFSGVRLLSDNKCGLGTKCLLGSSRDNSGNRENVHHVDPSHVSSRF